MPHPPYHPKPHTPALPQTNPLRQRNIRLKLQRKAQNLHPLVLHVFFMQQFSDPYIKMPRQRPVHAAGERQDMAGQNIFEEGKAFGDAVEGSVAEVVVGVERLPVVQAVVEVAIPHVEGVLVDVELGDAQRHGLIGRTTARAALADFQRPVRLTKKMMRFFNALIEAEQQGAEAAVVWLHFVLDQWIAMVEAAGLVVVVVEPLVFQADFVSHSAAKAGKFPGVERRVEANGQGSELVHAVRDLGMMVSK